jgi:hypothetical protein
VGEKLVTQKFRGHTTGFANPADRETAVCLLPGTELGFDEDIKVQTAGVSTMFGSVAPMATLPSKVAMFMQFPESLVKTWRDGFELPSGEQFKLNQLAEGQTVTVLQMPSQRAAVSHVDLPAAIEEAVTGEVTRINAIVDPAYTD